MYTFRDNILTSDVLTRGEETCLEMERRGVIIMENYTWGH